MRVYEELFIMKPDAPEEEVEAYLTQVKDIVAKGSGTVDKVDNWGVRKLAYRISKFSEGRYILMQFSSSSSDLVHEIERRMRVTDSVVKFITVRIDEKLKKIAKRKKSRDKRAARRPAPVAPPPAMPMAPAEPVAAAPGVPVEAKPMPAAPVAPATPPVTPGQE